MNSNSKEYLINELEKIDFESLMKLLKVLLLQKKSKRK